MNKKIKWGVVGCGGIAARRFIPEFQEIATDVAELVSVMDIKPDIAKQVAAKFAVPHYCTSEDELLQQDIDMVCICTPLDLHCQVAVKAARAGKHILCEKPIALNEQEVDQIEQACNESNVKFMLSYCMRNNIYNRKVRELVQSGALGQMVMGRAQLTCWYPPIEGAWRQDRSRSGGGSLADLGVHCFDLLEWIMDSRIVEVTGFQNSMTHKYCTDVEDASSVLLRFQNGAHGFVDNYFNLPDAAAQNSLELHGTKGSILCNGTIGQDAGGKMFSILQSHETGYDPNQVRDNQVDRQEYNLEGDGVFGQIIKQFSKCIIENLDSPIGIEAGRHSVKLINSIYKAVRKKRVVRVENS